MAHASQNLFFQKVKAQYPEHFSWVNVCEIGSLDINGTIRTLFDYPNYVGFDVGLGPAVDYAVPGEQVQYKDDSFDITVSSECFEHAEGWKDIFANMVRMTRPGGLIVMTCAGEGRPEHGTSRTDAGSSPLTVAAGIEYYGNLTAKDFDGLMDGLAYTFYENDRDKDLYLLAVKGEKQVKKIGLEDIDWNGWTE